MAHEHPVAGRFEVLVLDDLGASAHGVEGSLVDQVGQVGTTHARRAPGHGAEVDGRVDPLVLAVHLQDGQPFVEVGEWHDDLPVEPTGTQDGGVEDVGPVGGGHDHDAFGRIESVHLREHLVECLLTLVVATTQTGAPLAADGVDLVDEHDGRRLLAGGGEQVAHPAGADPHEHLHEVRSADRHERNPGLAGDRPGQQRLAGSRRADQKDALGDAGADLLESRPGS